MRQEDVDLDLERAHYSRLDRWLHRLALGFTPIAELSFDIERARILGEAPPIADRPVFVAGFARSGSTLLTQLLYASGAFASPTYMDLPFPLAPNLWSRLSRANKRQVARAERGHKDGVAHDLDSPDAIEEVFWRVFEGRNYINRGHVRPHNASRATREAFQSFVQLHLLNAGRGRYLSKNNNNILRLPDLVSTFPNAILLHPFRRPLDQAVSLLKQHKLSKELHQKDRFRADFMRWLGHHEFGSDHRPFQFNAQVASPRSSDTIGYWLMQWNAAYQFLLDQPEIVQRNQIWCDYDALCQDPTSELKKLATIVGVDRRLIDWRSISVLQRAADHFVEPELLQASIALHKKLVARAQRT
jgi:Sulfotransferase family